MTRRGIHTRFKVVKMSVGSFFSLFLLVEIVLSEETTTISAATTLGKLYRQARSEQYGYASRYGSDSSVTSGAIGIRPEPVEHRDAAYFESRCITCDQHKPSVSNRGWRQRPRIGYYEDDLEERRYRDRYDDRYERVGGAASGYEYEKPRGPGLGYEYEKPRSPGLGYEYEKPRGPGLGYEYERPRGPTFEYDRARVSPYDYDRPRTPGYEHDRPDPYSRNELLRPIPMMGHGDRYDMRYDRDRTYYDPPYDPRYDPKYDRNYERGNGYDNLDQRYQAYGGRYDRYNVPRRPVDPYDPPDPYIDRYNRNNYWMRYDPYDRYEKYDPYDRHQYRKPYEDRYSLRGGSPDSRGYQTSGSWGPGYDRGYASAWNYSGLRDNWRDYNRDRDPGNGGDNWRDLNRDRDSGAYRPRDYFYDSTAAPGAGSRVTSYLHDRPESSTKPDSTDRDKPTSSPQSQDNKVYQD